jgi:hypothetical protein
VRTDILTDVAALIPAHARLLELGCGWGTALAGFHQAGHDAIGVEATSHRAAFVRERLGLTYGLPRATRAAIEALQTGIKAGQPLTRLARWLPLRLGYAIEGGWTWFY